MRAPGRWCLGEKFGWIVFVMRSVAPTEKHKPQTQFTLDKKRIPGRIQTVLLIETLTTQ